MRVCRTYNAGAVACLTELSEAIVAFSACQRDGCLAGVRVDNGAHEALVWLSVQEQSQGCLNRSRVVRGPGRLGEAGGGREVLSESTQRERREEQDSRGHVGLYVRVFGL